MVNLGKNIDISNEGEEQSGEDNVSQDVRGFERTVNDDREVLLRPVVGTRPIVAGYVGTTWVASLLLLMTVGLGGLVIVMAVAWPANRNCETYFFALYARAIYWTSSHLCDVFIRKKHVDSRVDGYLDFYKKTMKISRAPHYICNIFSIIFLTMAGLIHQHYGDFNDRCMDRLINPVNLVSTFIVLETVLVAALLITYIIMIQRFNKQKLPPDALKHEWMASFIHNSFNEGEVGYRESDSHVSDLLEKQADLMRNLKEQNERLTQKVMIYSRQLMERNTASIS